MAEITPDTRDRSIDVLRLGSLLVVVLGHGVMLLVHFDEVGLRLENLLGYTSVLQGATWALQVLPLFFFAGAAASARGCAGGTAWGTWLFRRAQRLYRPVFYYLGFWILIGTPLIWLFIPPEISHPVMALSVQLLWFIGAYLAVLACLPLLARIEDARQLWLTVGGLYALTGLMDVMRISGFGSIVGFSNFLWVWLIPAALGVGYWRGVIRRDSAVTGALAMLVVDIGLVYWGPYELSLIGIEGQKISNMVPPSLLLAGHCVVLCLLAVAVAPWLDRWARRARVWWFVAIGNGGAMTLYLWHIPALVVVFGVSHALGHDRSTPEQDGFIALLLIQMIAFLALTAVLFRLLLPLETLPIPWWDSEVDPTAGRRSVAAGIAVAVAAIATLLVARDGLTYFGVAMICLMLISLAVARDLVRAPRSVAGV
ncbi:MAG: acyltransferase [Candidatus Nanopelagicales bacterium]|nr:acyltransferase [Candidatus Nanopelagicales bacterium]